MLSDAYCEGNSLTRFREVVVCAECNGRGYNTEVVLNKVVRIKCEACEGAGKFYENL
ncbi:MAG: hypothetical protein L3V56_03640 [Candidatus Magnetoovum sp. WYHC-5]|nr:hypothetical protein [Candidatus Magnetoovum sp. WYHC-5]